MSYLIAKLDSKASADMRVEAYEEMREIWEVRKENTSEIMSEILDAMAAISALISITIFEQPALSRLLLGFSKVARSIGL